MQTIWHYNTRCRRPYLPPHPFSCTKSFGQKRELNCLRLSSLSAGRWGVCTYTRIFIPFGSVRCVSSCLSRVKLHDITRRWGRIPILYPRAASSSPVLIVKNILSKKGGLLGGWTCLLKKTLFIIICVCFGGGCCKIFQRLDEIDDSF